MVIAGQKQQRFSEIKAGLDDADGLVIYNTEILLLFSS